MKIRQHGANGFAHYTILAAAVMAVAIVGVFVLVLRHSGTPKANLETASTASHSPTKLSTSAQTTSGASSASPTTSQSAGSTTTTKSSTAKTSTGTRSTSASSSSSSGSSDTTQAKAETPTQALTDIINSLNAGGLANVTATSVSVPAAVSGTVSARPIVFTVNGATYFAYTRVNPPNFNTDASTTVNSMVIVPASGSYSLVTAYVGKTGYLTGPNSEYVGYTPSSN